MKQCRDITIGPETPILEVIKILDHSSMQIALVADEAGHLLGTVTDGDVRRGILGGVAMECGARMIMNPKPIVFRVGDPREVILETMKRRQIHQIPILDVSGRIAGIEILDDLLLATTSDNWVVLMAGGQGNRLRPLTDDRPKPLLEIGGKPIMEIILESFIEQGFRRFFISVNYKAEMIRAHFGDGARWGAQLAYLAEDQALGTAGALGLLPSRPQLPMVVMNADLLTKVNFQQLLSFHREHRATATMCVRDYSFQVPYGVAHIDRHRLRDLDEKPVHHFFVNAGIYILEPGVLDLIPQGEAHDMTDLFDRLIERGDELTVFPIREYWLDIGRLGDYQRAQTDFPEVFES
jgi:dTDP-glucose pyrophosphorylase